MSIYTTIVGHLGADAELRQTNSGKSVSNLRIACNLGYGEQKRVQWVDAALFGRRAESLTPYLTKGTQVVVVADETEARPFKSKKEGNLGAVISARVQDIKLVGSKDRNSNDVNNENVENTDTPTNISSSDDIPF